MGRYGFCSVVPARDRSQLDRERMTVGMAIAAINWAFQQKGLKPTVKFVLVTLADRANASEWSCYPSLRDISERTGLHMTTVQRALDVLMALKLVIKENRMREGGGYTSSIYKLNRPDTESALHDYAQSGIAIMHSADTLPAQCVDPPRAVHKRLYKEEPSTEPTTNRASRITEKMCEEIYKLYPRKRGRGAALKAIKKAIKDFGFDDLKAAVVSFAEEWKTKLANGEDIKFCPWPQKFFNEQRYRDEPDIAPHQTTSTTPQKQGKQMSVWELKQLRDTLQEDARQIRQRYCAEEAHFTSWDSEAKRKEYADLQTQVKELNRQLSGLAKGREEPLEEQMPDSVVALVAGITKKGGEVQDD